MEFRYNALGHQQDEELSRILSDHEKAAEAKNEVPPTRPEKPAFERLRNSPLDKVKHIIEQKGKEAASAALGEFYARERLMGIQQGKEDLLDLFLEK